MWKKSIAFLGWHMAAICLTKRLIYCYYDLHSISLMAGLALSQSPEGETEEADQAPDQERHLEVVPAQPDFRNDVELVAILQGKSHLLSSDEAFKLLYEDHHGFVCSLLFRMGLKGAEIDDCAQDVWVRVFRFIHHFKSSKDRKFTSWLAKIATNQAYDYHRQHKIRPISPLTAIDDEGNFCFEESRFIDPLRAVLSGELRRRVSKKLQLQPQFAAVLALDAEGYGYHEIADGLGIPLGTVCSRIGRGRKLLKQLLEEDRAMEDEMADDLAA